MIPVKRVLLNLNGEEVELLAAIADVDSELKGVRDFITSEYKRRGYISPEVQLLTDEFDAQSVYFGTYCNGELLAAARIVESDKLPTESVFYDFTMPEPLAKCNREMLREVGRLTATKRPGENPLPRHILSTMTISALIDYGFKKDLCGGVSTITTSFMRLFEKLRLPALHEIAGAKLVYPQDGVLANFFYNGEEPAVPVYYLEDEAKTIFDGLFRNIALRGRTLLEEPLQILSHEVLI